ncbi:MAG TPA: dipeptide epimerase [Candidatus Marinimicrobia bacterium]|nr:dipeptide epimerase [Candidatus Neomarinimicrobiota bacterium]
MRIKIHEYDLPLKYKFGISRETRTVQKTLIAELIEDGISGYGEAVANHRYYAYTFDQMKNELLALQPILEDHKLYDSSPELLWQTLKPRLSHNPFALCALDMAAYDLWGKLHKKASYKLLGLNTSQNPVTDYTIGIDEIPIMLKKMKEFADWPVFKIKVGTNNDIEIMRALRSATDAVLRVDANCGWTAAQTIEYSFILRELGVEFIEQPLPAEDWEAMKSVFEQSALPIVADESVVGPGDVERCYGFFHGVNIKVVKCGGITPALMMIKKARQLNMQVMAGCMTESTVGISGISQLLPLLDSADLDGPLLLASDIAEGVTIDKGVIKYSEKFGNGVTLTAKPLNTYQAD